MLNPTHYKYNKYNQHYQYYHYYQYYKFTGKKCLLDFNCRQLKSLLKCMIVFCLGNSF